jgi:hypothetical protein
LAGLSGFLSLIQSDDGPDRSGAVNRLETMPSRPIWQAAEHRGAIVVGVRGHLHATGGACQQPSQPCLALAERQRPEALVIDLQQVEGLEDGLAHSSMAVQSIEFTGKLERSGSATVEAAAFIASSPKKAAVDRLSPGPE